MLNLYIWCGAKYHLLGKGHCKNWLPLNSNSNRIGPFTENVLQYRQYRMLTGDQIICLSKTKTFSFEKETNICNHFDGERI